MPATFDIEAEFSPWDCGWCFAFQGDTLTRCLETLPRELGRPLADWERERVEEGFDCGLSERVAEASRPKAAAVDMSEVPW